MRAAEAGSLSNLARALREAEGYGFGRRHSTGFGGSSVVDAAAALAASSRGQVLTANGQLIVLACAYFESGFGTIPGLGFVNDDGTPSHNWGARKGEGDAGCIMHGDSDEVGKVCFSAFSSAVLGAEGFFRTRAWGSTGYREATIAAANAGDAWGTAAAMYAGSYYTGFGCSGHALPKENTPEDDACRIRGYAKAIASTARQTIAPSLGASPDLVFYRESTKAKATKSAGFGNAVAIGAVALAAGALLYWAFDDIERLVT